MSCAPSETQRLIDDMIETMRAAGGAGLAANQVSALKRIAVAEVDHNPRYPYKPPIPLTVMVNPVLEPLGEETLLINEGCLSVPDLRGDLERFVSVKARFLDRSGAPQELVAEGLTAGTFQHEVDHLDGVLFLDRVQDPRSFSTWEEFERHGKRAFLRAHPPVGRGRGAMSSFWCELAWLGGLKPEPGVLLDVEGETISSVQTGVAAAPPGAERLHGLVIPGLANAHSHAFQRALARDARTRARGSFWTWREQMYGLADVLDPDIDAGAGTGHVRRDGAGRDHRGGGVPLRAPRCRAASGTSDPNAMGEAVLEGAREAGVRITLLDTCYLHGGIGAEPDPAQRRFCDADADEWAARVDALAEGAATPGSARPSTASARSIPRRPRLVAAWAADRSAPLHAHVSEQPAENEACLEAYGLTPMALLAQAGAVSPRFTAVHATHVSDEDVPTARGGRRVLPVCARPPSATSPTGSVPLGGCAMRARCWLSAATRTR